MQWFRHNWMIRFIRGKFFFFAYLGWYFQRFFNINAEYILSSANSQLGTHRKVTISVMAKGQTVYGYTFLHTYSSISLRFYGIFFLFYWSETEIEFSKYKMIVFSRCVHEIHSPSMNIKFISLWFPNHSSRKKKKETVASI